MSKYFWFFLMVMLILSIFSPLHSMADPLIINFDSKMTMLWNQSAWWGIITGTGYLPPGFTLLPGVCDLNGGFDISVKPIELYPNGILDSDELALIGAILANPAFDCSASGGTTHEQVHDAWNQNYERARLDLGCCVGGPENLFTMFPQIDYLFAGLMTLGDQDSQAFPFLLMNLAVNDATVSELVHDPNIRVPNPDEYYMLRQYLAWCGDADGDGCSNGHEYSHFYPLGGRAAYISAAMDPSQSPPDCTGDDRLCDGSGGLLGEYFDERNMTNLKLTRIDQQVTFNWGGSSPSPLLDANSFSVCWTGWVIPDYSEAYTFSVRTDDGVRLWVNNELLVDQWNDHGSTTYTGTPSAPLVAGTKYPIRVDFYENGGDAVAWLGWASEHQTASGATKAIYEINLRPGVGMGDRTSEWIQNPHNGHRYKLTEPMTWNEGRSLAESLGAYLVSFNDDAESTWIFQTFGVVGENFYIGANDIAQEGRWVWQENGDNFWNGVANGSVVSGHYANWNSGEPNDAGGEDCGMYYAGSGKWNDLNGSSSLRCLLETNVGIITYNGPLPGNATIREGKPFSLEVEVTRSWGVVRYQWMQNGEDIPGATDSRLDFTPVRDLDEGYYACRITDDTNATVQTEEVLLTVLPLSMFPLLSSTFSLIVAIILVCSCGCVSILGKKRCSLQ